MRGVAVADAAGSELGNVILAEARLSGFARFAKKLRRSRYARRSGETARNTDDADPATDSASARIDGE